MSNHQNIEITERARVPSEVESWQFPGWGKTQHVHVRKSLSPNDASIIRDALAAHESGIAVSAPTSDNENDNADMKSDDRQLSPVSRLKRAPTELEVTKTNEKRKSEIKEKHEKKLGQWLATAICGNDILSSCLYTVGLCVSVAGVYAPLAMLLIIGMLHLFRFVYSEVGTALPLNGGVYNCLLNTTSKSTASIAACLTILSYVSTAVVSATEACEYLKNLWTDLPVLTATIALLGCFGFLALMGISESAVVATLIFAFHTISLTLLVIFSCIHVAKHGMSVFLANASQQTDIQPDIGKALLYGYSAASLGITGFETSANFIEEQKEGVFPKTLRNMWISVFFFNPVLCFLSLSALSFQEILGNSNTVLSTLGQLTAGRWLEILLSVDAFTVLSGAVITSYVGIVGLLRRLAMDQCLPSFLLQQNSWRHTNHWIIILFFAVCVSLLEIFDGEVSDIGGMYSIAFLCVMSLFAVGNMMLKYKRNHLPRPIRAAWSTVISAFLLVVLALIMTIVRNTEYFLVFALYFTILACIFAFTFNRVSILQVIYYSMTAMTKGTKYEKTVQQYLTKKINEINSRCVGFFAKNSKLSVLNKAILYIRENEPTNWVRMIHVAASIDSVPRNLSKHVALLDRMYPKIRIDLVIMYGEFGPDAVDTASQEFGIPKTMLFITCPSANFSHKIENLGGVRVIAHWDSSNEDADFDSEVRERPPVAKDVQLDS